MANLEQIKDQLEWGKENLDSPQDNLSLKDVEWLIEQAEKVEALEKRLNELAQTSYCIICGDDATEVRQGRFYCHECCN